MQNNLSSDSREKEGAQNPSPNEVRTASQINNSVPISSTHISNIEEQLSASFFSNKVTSSEMTRTSENLETTDLNIIAAAIQKLNPDVRIRADEDKEQLYISVPIDQLKLPAPFYYNDKNGITNKHKSASGSYTCIRPIVEPLSPDNGLMKFLRSFFS